MRFNITGVVLSAVVFSTTACSNELSNPAPQSAASIAAHSSSLGPQIPPFNLEVILRGDGFGLVKFRQPNDAEKTIFLDTWLRDLEPNTSYLLQRAVDTNVDGDCTSSAWLTLGKGLVPQAITTDAAGTGREELFRSVAAIADGARFDIHFRVIDATTQAVVLTSGCYEYVVNP